MQITIAIPHISLGVTVEDGLTIHDVIAIFKTLLRALCYDKVISIEEKKR